MASVRWRVTAELNALTFAIGVACGLFPTPVVAQDDVAVEVETGRLAGVRQGTVAVFKGVPYAAPPVGPLRWQPPQRAAPGGGRRRSVITHAEPRWQCYV